MVENSLRRLAERDGRTRASSSTVLEACAEVGRPILFGVGIIIVVYLPILTLQGVEGKMFTPDGAHGGVRAGRLAAPDLHRSRPCCCRSSCAEDQRAGGLPDAMAQARLRAGAGLDACAAGCRCWSRPRLRWSCGRARRVPFLGSEFIPRLDEGALALQVLRLPSVSLEESVQQATHGGAAAPRGFPGRDRDVVSKTGRPRSPPTRWASTSATSS